MKLVSIVVTLGGVAATLIVIGRAPAVIAQTPESPKTAAPAAATQPDYHPSLGDLMTLAVQPRHIKLGLAGEQKNWAYAAYELSELKNAFARVGRTVPVYRNVDMPGLISGMTNAPLDALDQAIKAKDAAKFATAYATLTSTCNACHVSQEHAMIVIRTPATNAYPDQDFRASGR
ncbi:MAG TPA: hypothetical protein VGM84_10825 [Steroidobacteraceae bacterium]